MTIGHIPDILRLLIGTINQEEIVRSKSPKLTRKIKPWPEGWPKTPEELYLRYAGVIPDHSFPVQEPEYVAFGQYLDQLIRNSEINIILISAITDINPSKLFRIMKGIRLKYNKPDRLTEEEFEKLQIVLKLDKRYWEVLPPVLESGK